MPQAIGERVVIRPEPLPGSSSVGQAVHRLLELDLPALPVVDDEGRYAGIFGEREFFAALFPGYFGQLGGAAFVTRSLDEALERRAGCVGEGLARHVNAEHVEVREDYSDAQIAETFLHHRVLVVPILDREKRPVGLVTRSAFFRALAERVSDVQG